MSSPIEQTLASLDALREKATRGKWNKIEGCEDGEIGILVGGKFVKKHFNDWDDKIYLTALHNAFPAFRQAILDGMKYKEAATALAKAVEESVKVCAITEDERCKSCALDEPNKLGGRGKNINCVERLLSRAAARNLEPVYAALLAYRQSIAGENFSMQDDSLKEV